MELLKTSFSEDQGLSLQLRHLQPFEKKLVCLRSWDPQVTMSGRKFIQEIMNLVVERKQQFDLLVPSVGGVSELLPNGQHSFM